MCKNVAFFILITQFDFLTLESYDRHLNLDCCSVQIIHFLVNLDLKYSN